MHRDDTSASFLSRWMRPQRASAASDWADYGTAFALDLSMAEGTPQEVDPLPMVAAKASSEGWLARLRRRG